MLVEIVLPREPNGVQFARLNRARDTQSFVDFFDMTLEVGFLAKRLETRAPDNGATERSDVDIFEVPIEEVFLLEECGGTVRPATFGWTIPRLQHCISMGFEMSTGLNVVLKRKVDHTAWPGATNHSSWAGASQDSDSDPLYM
jgi:hypothetical protein